MKNKIYKLLQEIKNKKIQIWKEYDKLKNKYWFKIDWKKIIWNKLTKKQLKKSKKSILDTLFSAQIRELLSIPFIWIMIIPAIILDIFIFIYQNTAIRLYKIPFTKRSNYIIFDRKQLAYLNIIQKINCIYCSYFNWLMQYAVEVAWKTERYWCPIKNARKKYWEHEWEKYFAEYWDVEWFKDSFCKLDDFKKIKKQ